MSNFEQEQTTAAREQRSSRTRRAFTLSAGAAAVAALVAFRRPMMAAGTTDGSDGPATVTIVTFTADGKRSGKQTTARVLKTEAAWQQQLSPIAFRVTRQAGTERAYTGAGWDEHGTGLFRCICCETALFSSKTKFDSGTGWPSFWEPIARENVLESNDGSLGMARTAVSCRLCAAHLGHVFDDGPAPTGLRYCMNAAAMHFVKAA